MGTGYNETVPFYFKSYDRVLGVARNVDELRSEVARLADEDPGALEYHLGEGHIMVWLESMGRKDVAEELRRVRTAGEAKAWAAQRQTGGAKGQKKTPARKTSTKRKR